MNAAQNNGPKKEELEKSVRAYKRKNIGMAVGSAAVVAALWLMHKPAPERLPPQECPAPITCPAGPQQGGTCDVENGEHDPTSPTFDAICGTCGDGVRQPTETADNCPVDFHCGNGKVDRREVYGAWVERDGAWSLDKIEITESCNQRDPAYCEADCHPGSAAATAEHDRRVRTPRPGGSANPAATGHATPAVVSGGPCPASEGGSDIAGDVRSALDGAGPSLRRAHGADDSATVVSRATISVSAQGRVTGVSVSSSCIGSCQNPSIGTSGIVGNTGVVGQSIGIQPGNACTISVSRRHGRQ
jgi:hypothetical protein